MGNRYFPATAMGGRLFIDSGASARDEAIVDTFTNPRIGHRKVRTIEELDEIVRFSERGLPSIQLWIHESLLSTAQGIANRA